MSLRLFLDNCFIFPVETACYAACTLLFFLNLVTYVHYTLEWSTLCFCVVV